MLIPLLQSIFLKHFMYRRSSLQYFLSIRCLWSRLVLYLVLVLLVPSAYLCSLVIQFRQCFLCSCVPSTITIQYLFCILLTSKLRIRINRSAISFINFFSSSGDMAFIFPRTDSPRSIHLGLRLPSNLYWQWRHIYYFQFIGFLLSWYNFYLFHC